MVTKSVRKIGNYPVPKKECDDANCPFHGTISLRGRTHVGKVVSTKAHRTVSVQWERPVLVRKFKRFLRKNSRVYAHASDCMDIKEGDIVTVIETRPLSKTKRFVVVEVKE